MIERLFDLANIILLVGTILLIKDVVKNRNVLRGYSLLGSSLTFTGVLLFETGFFLLGFYVSMLLGLVTLLYWFLVVLYLLLNRFKARKPGVVEINISAESKAGAKS